MALLPRPTARVRGQRVVGPYTRRRRQFPRNPEASMPDKITAKTGDAPIKKLGHTSGNLYGQDPNRKSTMRRAPQEKSAK